MIRRFRADTGLVNVPLVREPEGIWIRALYPSADGRTIAYLAWSRSTRVAELHALDLSSMNDRVLARLETRLGPDLQNKGWAHLDRSIILVRRAVTNTDGTDTIELFGVDLAGTSGAPRRLATVDRAFFATTRLDADRSVLYVTRSDGLVHNLYAVSLGSGELRRLTNNQFAAVTFSGIERLPNGRILCVRDQKRRDIWIIRRTSPPPAVRR